VAGFLRRLFRLGVVPDALRAELEPEGMLAVFENVAVRYRFSGHVPGLISAGEVRAYSGALVVTGSRLAGTLSVLPGSAGRAIDVPWTTGDDGAVHLTIDETGVHIAIDLARVSPSDFTGTQTLDYVQPLSAELLAQLPKRSFGFDIPREYALRLAGVPVRPPKAAKPSNPERLG
jgi:hypothetical protein